MQELKVWEKIVIVVGDGKKAGKYVCRIEDIINGGIVITNPEYVQGESLLRNDIDVTIHVTRDDAIYEFTSHIKQLVKHGVTYAILRPPRTVRRVQRRLFVRVELVTDLKFLKLTADFNWAEDRDKLKFVAGRTVDVSAGGFLMSSGEEFSEGDLFLMKLDYFAEVDLPAWVIGQCRRAFRDEGRYKYGVAFVLNEELSKHFSKEEIKKLPPAVRSFREPVQDRLARCLFDQQIDLRNKGLL
jgi:c-di-GMP-binding flagellar brake protein YcgR